MINLNAGLKADVVFAAYRDRVESELMEALREHMEPLLKDAAAKAAQSLSGEIQEHYNIASRETIVAIDLRINQEKV